MTYRIIGGDGREYGASSAEELLQWIAEGRLSGQSLVKAEATEEWKPLSAYPEFAEALGTQPRQAADPAREAKAWLAEVVSRRPEVSLGDCLARSWELLRSNAALLVGACFLVWLIEALCESLKAADIVYLVLRGVFYGGLSMVFINRFRGLPASTGDVFGGFSRGFAQLLLAGFISYLAVLFCSCLIVPGIYLFIAWIFSLPLVADKRLEFWSAMELSRRVVTPVWFQVFALFLVAFLPTLLMHAVIQAKVAEATLPLVQSLAAPNSAFDYQHVLDIFNQAGEAAKISPVLLLAAKLVYLLNLPFGLGALLAAYENLFRSRPAPSS